MSKFVMVRRFKDGEERLTFKQMENYASRGKGYRPLTARGFGHIYNRGPDHTPHLEQSLAITRIHHLMYKNKYEPLTEKLCYDRDRYYALKNSKDWRGIDYLEADLHTKRILYERILEFTNCTDEDKRALAGINFLLGRIYLDKIPDARDRELYKEVSEYASRAQGYYQDARNLFKAIPGIDISVQYALDISMIAIAFNQIPKHLRKEYRNQVVDIFNVNGHRDLALKVIEREYFQWVAIRNLMIEFSYKQDEQGYLQAFRKLTSVHKNFAKLSYKPGTDVQSISEDIDTKDYVHLLREQGYED